MRTLRFFTLPTLLGWSAAFLTCALLHFVTSVTRYGTPYQSVEGIGRDYTSALVVAGLTIVFPTYTFVILPLSIAALRTGKLSRRVLFALLMSVGATITALFALLKMTDIGWASSRSVQILLFYSPFVPYALVVAFAAKHFLPHGREA